MLKQDDFNKTHLVTMGWRFGQAYGGGVVPGQYVMQTLANRVRAGWGSWLDIIERVPLYMAENELPPLKLPSVWEPTFVKLLHSVDAIYDSSFPDGTKGALYFCDLNRIERHWFKSKVVDATQESTGLRAHPMVANNGTLSFFK